MIGLIMEDCGCGPPPAETETQKRTLWIALALNATMFVAEVTAGLFANSTGLIADGLDMLSDASAYAIAPVAIGRSDKFKANAGGMLLLILGVVFDVVRRAVSSEPPEGAWMIGVAAIALAVNAIAPRLLGEQKSQEVHTPALSANVA